MTSARTRRATLYGWPLMLAAVLAAPQHAPAPASPAQAPHKGAPYDERYKGGPYDERYKGGPYDEQAPHKGGPDDERVMTAVRAAMAPALPYPESDESGSLPKDETSTVAWMVRPHAPGDRSLEVIANPLNLANQQRATKAMAQIQASVESAQRRSEAQYERAIAEAKRTGRSQEVDGVTLSDEGLAGARIDAEAHLTIDVDFNQPRYSFPVASSIEPSASRTVVIPGAVAVTTVPSNVYRQKLASASEERFCPAETVVFFGALNAPDVHERSDTSFEVTADAAPSGTAPAVRSLVIRLRGNDTLIAQILRTADWTRVADLLK